MELKDSIKQAALFLGVLALVSITAVAQESRSEISLQGTGFFTKDTDGNGIRQHTTDTGGFLVGYRYNLNRWLAAEANYGYDRNTQTYFGGTGARVESIIHQITGSAVVNLPSFAKLQPYALAGGGALGFDPTGNSGGNFAGATSETRGAFVYGAGADYAFTKHISLRAEYRGYLYKAPDFNFAGLNTGSLDAYYAAVGRLRVPLLISRGRRRATGVQPSTRATPKECKRHRGHPAKSIAIFVASYA